MDNNDRTIRCEIEIIKVTLLPVEKALTVKKCAGKGAENIWYCLKGSDKVVLVNASGRTFDWPDGCDYLWSGVRPALMFSRTDGGKLAEGDRFRMAGHTFTVISNGLALCDELIFHKTLTLTEVKAATLPADSPEVTPDEKDKFDFCKKFPQDNPCTIEGIDKILMQWIEKVKIRATATDRKNIVELVKK
jgi:hypothetical protein